MNPQGELTMKLGEFVYDGNGQLLTKDEQYTVYDVGSEVEAYPVGASEPVVMNKGAFVSLINGRLEKVKGYTPMA